MFAASCFPCRCPSLPRRRPRPLGRAHKSILANKRVSARSSNECVKTTSMRSRCWSLSISGWSHVSRPGGFTPTTRLKMSHRVSLCVCGNIGIRLTQTGRSNPICCGRSETWPSTYSAPSRHGYAGKIVLSLQREGNTPASLAPKTASWPRPRSTRRSNSFPDDVNSYSGCG